MRGKALGMPFPQICCRNGTRIYLSSLRNGVLTAMICEILPYVIAIVLNCIFHLNLPANVRILGLRCYGFPTNFGSANFVAMRYNVFKQFCPPFLDNMFLATRAGIQI
jgi:hypothetical protein